MGRGRRTDTTTGAARAVEVPGTEHRIYRLRPGVLDETAVACFSQGQCHALAMALHEETGWPLVVVADWLEQVDHVAVRTPEGRIIDGAGVHDPDAFAEAWDGDVLEVSAQRLRELTASATWREPALDVARTMVAAVLGYRSGERPSREPGPLEFGVHADPPSSATVRRAGGQRVVVRRGVLDEPTRGLFRGPEQSGALASALFLAEETGAARILLVVDEDDEPRHAALRLEDGRILDVDGVASPEAFAARWPGSQRIIKRPGDLDEELEHCEDPWPKQDLAAAELVSDQLIAAAGLTRGRAG